jgi:hypothetical protein
MTSRAMVHVASHSSCFVHRPGLQVAPLEQLSQGHLRHISIWTMASGNSEAGAFGVRRPGTGRRKAAFPTRSPYDACEWLSVGR